MIARKSILMYGVLAAFFVEPVYSQSDTLSLTQAISLARTNNPGVRASEIGVRQSASHVNELKASRLPPLLFHTHFLHSPGSGYNEAVTNGGEYGVQLSSSIPLYDGGARGALIDQSLNSVENSTLNLHKSESEVVFAVRVAYYDILRAQEEFRTRDETVARLEDYRMLVDHLRLGGSANSSDVLKADVDLNNAKIARDQSERSIRKLRFSLSSAIGIPARDWIELPPPPDEDSVALGSATFEKNYELQMLERDRASALFDVDVAKAERLPVLSVTGDVGALGVHPSEIHDDFGYSLFLSLDFPLFNWGAISERVEQKELAREEQAAQAKARRSEVEAEWNMTVNDLDAARNALAGYSVNMVRAEENYVTAKSRFAGGAGSNLEVLDAQRLLVETKLNYTGALFQLHFDRAALLKLSGQ